MIPKNSMEYILVINKIWYIKTLFFINSHSHHHTFYCVLLLVYVIKTSFTFLIKYDTIRHCVLCKKYIIKIMFFMISQMNDSQLYKKERIGSHRDRFSYSTLNLYFIVLKRNIIHLLFHTHSLSQNLSWTYSFHYIKRFQLFSLWIKHHTKIICI